MDSATTRNPEHNKETYVPKWEHSGVRANGENGAPATNSSPRASLVAMLDSALSPHRRYPGLCRNTFLLILLAVILALLALIIGLAVGLTQSSNSPSNLPLPSNTDTFDGELTYYAPGLGACGLTSTAQDDIVSLSHLLFDAAGSSSSKGGNSNENPLCERKLRARRFNEGADEWRSVDLRVVDRCTGCAPRDLDVSEAVFKKLAEINDGRVEVEWAWLDGEGDGEA